MDSPGEVTKAAATLRSQEEGETSHEAADKVMSTCELVEMILCDLPVKDIAQAQRVCRTFKDIIKGSRSIRRAIARQPWLPPQAYLGDGLDWSNSPMQPRLIFDTGRVSSSGDRLFCMNIGLVRPQLFEASFEHLPDSTWMSPDDSPTSTINPKNDSVSCQVWRFVRLARPRTIANFTLLHGNVSGYGIGYSEKTMFDSCTLGGLYDWLCGEAYGDEDGPSTALNNSFDER